MDTETKRTFADWCKEFNTEKRWTMKANMNIKMTHPGIGEIHLPWYCYNDSILNSYYYPVFPRPTYMKEMGRKLMGPKDMI